MITASVLMLLITLTGCSHRKPPAALAALRGAGPTAVARPGPGVRCHAGAGGQLPDRSCSPGQVNAAVTSRSVARTICNRTWTTRTRLPAQAVTEQLKTLMTIYGYAGQPLGRFTVAYVIPPSLGGSVGTITDLRNLWPAPANSAQPGVAQVAQQKVCTGGLPLSSAQRGMSGDWRTLGTRLGAIHPHGAVRG